MNTTLPKAENLYREALRPQFHFTSQRGWLNDPNGLVYYDGEYHLFYQHNPDGVNWDSMHWGHAVSRDLVHWRTLPIALYPDEMGTMFSGSAVVDWANTASLKQGEADTLVCFYTAAGKFADPPVAYTQCMAYSRDRGYTWQKYSSNPVLDHIADENRDPKVIWHEESGQWIMALYLENRDEGQQFGLYASPNSKEWQHLQNLYFPGWGECPDFFPLELDGDPENIKWIFWTADGHYVVGDFDGRVFTALTDPIHAYYGGDGQRGFAYAAQTWSDTSDGRRIQIPWLYKNFPGMPFSQQMGFPVELNLRSTDTGPRLHFAPVAEIVSLCSDKETLHNCALSDQPLILPSDGWDLLDIKMAVDVGDGDVIELNLRGVPVVYDSNQHKLECCGRTARVDLVDNTLHLRILLDRASIEIFAANGLVYMPFSVDLDKDTRGCTLLARNGEARVVNVEIFKLNSAWV